MDRITEAVAPVARQRTGSSTLTSLIRLAAGGRERLHLSSDYINAKALFDRGNDTENNGDEK